MIITVTLNAAIDKTLTVPNFRLGRRHRPVEQETRAGGKGVNIARALKALGRPVLATGFTGGPTGTRIVEQLTSESILTDFVRIKDESRTNMAVIDPTDGQQTEINERGPEVSESELQHFRDKLTYLAQGAEICVIAGSVPRGVPSDIYATLIQDLKTVGLTTILDTDGEALRHAIHAEPTVVSPNTLEAEELVGHEFHDQQDVVLALDEMLKAGSKEAIITTKDGCWAKLKEGDESTFYRVKTPSVEAISKVGSGDAFIAGYVAARYNGGSPDACLRFGVACGAESTRHLGAGEVEPSEVERLLQEVTVETEPAAV